ncbi:uncharacterized protein A4U43_C08F26190 [Asparagus officinalis]|nr:uncharacterized protein A4U43_C08F26190 [Asparagus officinalis]
MFTNMGQPSLKAHVNRHKHFGHDGTYDIEATHVFDENILLFLDSSSQERIEVICTGSYKNLREIITDVKFSVLHKDVSVKLHFLFGDGVPGSNSFFYYGEEYWYYVQGDCQFALLVIEHQVSFLFLQHLVVPRFMRYNLTNKEDSVKIGILKYEGGFHQEGLFETNIIGLCPGFVNEDAPVNEVVIVPNTFRNDLVKINA